MKPIDGYFEWESPPPIRNAVLHENSIYLNIGRHALEYILRGLNNVRCLWVPLLYMRHRFTAFEHIENSIQILQDQQQARRR